MCLPSFFSTLVLPQKRSDTNFVPGINFKFGCSSRGVLLIGSTCYYITSYYFTASDSTGDAGSLKIVPSVCPNSLVPKYSGVYIPGTWYSLVVTYTKPLPRAAAAASAGSPCYFLLLQSTRYDCESLVLGQAGVTLILSYDSSSISLCFSCVSCQRSSQFLFSPNFLSAK